MSRPGGLGRGLGALIPAAGPATSGLLTLDLSVIDRNPRQPRAKFDDGSLRELAASLQQVGMLQPILVRPLEAGRYQLIAGERRYRAAQLAGMATVPAVVRRTEDAELLTEALIENLHRADLGPLEEAAAFDQLLADFGLTHEALAARLGKSRSAISNALRLLALPAPIQARIEQGVLTAGHARALLAMDGPQRQELLAQRIVAEGLSVRATEELVRRDGERGDAATTMADLAGAADRRRSEPFPGLAGRIEDVLGTRVKIRGSDRRGTLVIDYAGREDLERILDVIGRGAGEDLLRE